MLVTMRIALAILVCLALQSTIPPTAIAQEAPTDAPQIAPPADVASLEAEIDAAFVLVDQRKWKDAHKAWIALLERHAGAAYAQSYLPEIRESLEACAFWSVTVEPKPKDVISGELVHYDRSTGRIKVRYTPETLGDFDGVGDGLRVHPMVFRGAYSIELSGAPEALRAAAYLVDLDENRATAVAWGERDPGAARYHVHQLVTLVDGKPTQKLQFEPQARTPSGAARAKIVVSPTEVLLNYDGERVGSAPKPKKIFGSWGISGEAKFASLLVEGSIETSWIDGRIDAFLHERRKTFLERYQPPSQFAAWPETRGTGSIKAEIERLFSQVTIYDTDTAARSKMVDEILELRATRPLDAIARLESAEASILSARSRLLLLAFCEDESDRPANALRHFDELARGETLPTAIALRRAMLLAEMERRSESIASFRDVLAREPNNTLIHFLLAQQLMLAGRMDEARKLIDDAAELPDPLAALSELRVLLAKAGVGPSWRRSFTVTGSHFLVASNVDQGTSSASAKELDLAWKRCNDVFGKVADPGQPMRAFVFAGSSGYQSYIDGISIAPHPKTAGLFSSLVDQIVAWNVADRATLMYTLRHECMHRYIDAVLGSTPLWFNEGFAEYFASMRQANGSWSEAAVNQSAIAKLVPRPVPTLTSFLFESPEQFMRDAEARYAQAWAFVHFCRRGRDRAASDFLARLWSNLAQATDTRSALDAALEGVDLDAMQKSFTQHVWRLIEAK